MFESIQKLLRAFSKVICVCGLLCFGVAFIQYKVSEQFANQLQSIGTKPVALSIEEWLKLPERTGWFELHGYVAGSATLAETSSHKTEKRWYVPLWVKEQHKETAAMAVMVQESALENGVDWLQRLRDGEPVEIQFWNFTDAGLAALIDDDPATYAPRVPVVQCGAELPTSFRVWWHRIACATMLLLGSIAMGYTFFVTLDLSKIWRRKAERKYRATTEQLPVVPSALTGLLPELEAFSFAYVGATREASEGSRKEHHIFLSKDNRAIVDALVIDRTVCFYLFGVRQDATLVVLSYRPNSAVINGLDQGVPLQMYFWDRPVLSELMEGLQSLQRNFLENNPFVVIPASEALAIPQYFRLLQDWWFCMNGLSTKVPDPVPEPEQLIQQKHNEAVFCWAHD